MEGQASNGCVALKLSKNRHNFKDLLRAMTNSAALRGRFLPLGARPEDFLLLL
jgi:hypothetical protein